MAVEYARYKIRVNAIAPSVTLTERVKKLLELCPELLNTRAAWDELPVEAAAHQLRSQERGVQHQPADVGGHGRSP